MSGGPAEAAAQSAGSRSPFVGRDGALQDLLAAVESGENERGVVALVAGEAGIGKTRLVTEVAVQVSCPVLWSACWEGDGAPAFWPWLQLLRRVPGVPGARPDARPASLAELVGVEAHEDAGSDARFRLFDAVAEVVGRACEGRALLLVIDDLHWADAASLRLLVFLARDPRARRVVVIGTYRDGSLDANRRLGEAIADLGSRALHLHLEGLSEAEVAALMGALPGGGAASAAGAVHRRSGGNPFFVHELVRLVNDGRVGSSSGRSAIPAGIEAVVSLRLGEVSTLTLELLTAAAVLGVEFDVAVLAPVTGTETGVLMDALDEARTAGLVVADGGLRTFAFVHAVVQEVLYHRLSHSERTRLHGLAADVLEERDSEGRVIEIAHHRVHAAADTDARAADWADRAAAHSFGVFAYEQAAVWCGHALRLLAPATDSRREGELLIRRAEASLAAGDVPEACESFRQAAVVARERGDAGQFARAALGLGSGRGGFEVPLHDRTQITLLEESLVVLGPTSSELRAQVLARLSVALSSMGVEDRRRSLSEDAIAMARKVGDDAALGYALAAHCDVIAGPDHSEARIAEASEIVDLAVRLGDRPLELLGRRLRLVALLEVGDVAAADEDRARFGAIADELGQPLYRWYAPLWQGMRALMVGDPVAAGAFTAAAERIGGLAHSGNASALTFTQRWVSQRYEGHYAESGAGMREVLGLGPGATPLVSGISETRLRAVIAAQVGDVEEARAQLDVLLSSGYPARPKDSEWLPEVAQVAEVSALVDHAAAASMLFEQLSPYAHRFCVEGIGAAFTGSVGWYLALLARALGDADAAASFEAAARAAHRRVGLVGDPPRIGAPAISPESRAVATPQTGWASMANEGATWSVTFAGSSRNLRDSKGLRDLAVLVARPHQEVHCLELAGGADVGGAAGPALDDHARRAYQQRIRDLQEDIDDARAANDLERADRAEVELDALVEQLSQAFGLSGRARPTGAAAERARSTVTSRIRAAIRQVAQVHPELGRHLDHAVRTGTWCSYTPEHPVAWEVHVRPP